MFQPNFERDHHLVAERRHRLAQDSFDFKRAIRFGGIEERHAAIVSRASEGDHVGPAWGGRIEGAGHVLAAESDARNLKLSEFAPPVHERFGRPAALSEQWPGRRSSRRR